MLLDAETAVPSLERSILSATCFGLAAKTKDGRAASLAVIDDAGAVLDSGEAVALAAWLLMCKARNNFMEGRGHIAVTTPP